MPSPLAVPCHGPFGHTVGPHAARPARRVEACANGAGAREGFDGPFEKGDRRAQTVCCGPEPRSEFESGVPMTMVLSVVYLASVTVSATHGSPFRRTSMVPVKVDTRREAVGRERRCN